MEWQLLESFQYLCGNGVGLGWISIIELPHHGFSQDLILYLKGAPECWNALRQEIQG